MTLPDHFLCCNCASCGRELLSRAHAQWLRHLSATARAEAPPLVRGRIDGRPYCSDCLDVRRPCGGTSSRIDEDAAQQNGVRALEDAVG